jgi:phospholipid/cholesterol/gamma-HCH transport system ATP-binding protein
MGNPIIELRDTAFTAQNKTIVRGINLALNQGQTCALIGPSGGGKSTVLKLAAGLILPTAGEAYFNGQGISTMTRQQTLVFRKEAAFVFQDSALWANQNIRQILELPLKIHFPSISQRERTQRIVEILALVGYKRDLDIRPAALSMGEQKLIAFARALTCDPSLLYLDEWTESLDDTSARRMVRLVKKRQEAGHTVVFVSHNLAVIKELAQRICMIVDGRLALDISGEELANNDNLSRMIEKGIAE